ncbi:tRNA modification GTPase [Altericroceibacterium spongiae]|uniref:tRNA modification GTPase n=1 Tax=Altericroceibacterium spongiae TaxID=2320269 RepID=A0A420EK23_9SPHN|nr:2,4'-dihydroxyacetophenone dioxygenase family protein [Altericroceibacterium spongiae]RKF21027.1 tRNA modification GTPase [Altericroceibacterium spongiae]
MASMTAPPSGAYKIVDVHEPFRSLIGRRGQEGTYIGGSEEESPWVPFGDNAAIRHLAFDVRQNVYCNILWIKSPGVIGTHKHRGPVWAVGLEGSFRYLEYDWVCKPGEFITETPGTAHTLVTDDPEGMKALFWMQGANEFYDEDGTFVETLDVWWFMNHYETYCREHGLTPNPQLYI